MYGIINKAIQEMILLNYNELNWANILEKAGIKDFIFISNESYDDEITYNLASAAVSVPKKQTV